MKRLALVAVLLLGGCASGQITVRDKVAFNRAQPWDVFWLDRGETKVMVIHADKWEFRDGCFIALEPVSYILCDVSRVRPCTEDCG